MASRTIPTGYWKDDHGDAPNDVAVNNAKVLLDICPEDVSRRVSPSVEGGITVSFYAGNKRAAMEFSNCGAISAVINNGSDILESWSLGVSGISFSMDRIREFLALERN